MNSKFIDELSRELAGRLLEIWEGRSGLAPAVEDQYRNLWRTQAGLAPRIEPCRFHGAATGETIACAPCGGRVRLKVYACSHPKHAGICTLESADAAVPDCHSCRWRNRDPAEPETIAPRERRIGKKHVLCHVLPIPRNGVWQRAVEQLRLRWKLFDGRKIFAVMTGTAVAQDSQESLALESVEAVRSLLPPDAETIAIPNDPNLREGVSWNPLWDRVLTDAEPNDAVLYCHTKGATRSVDPGNSCQWWASMLWSLSLDHWALVERELETYPVTGPFKKLGYGFGHDFGEWHFSGTFFWSHAASMRARYSIAVPRQWWGVEAWPGLAYRPDEASSIFTQGEVEDMDLYSPEFWAGTIRPRYEEWIAEHPPDWSWNK